MPNIVRYNGDGANFRGPSPALWGDLNLRFTDALQGKCLFFHDDFARPVAVDNTVQAFVGTGESDLAYCDNGVSIRGLDIASGGLIEAQGELQVAGNDADNDEGQIMFGTGKNFWIDNSANNTGELFFEARIKTASIADNGVSLFIGLTSTSPVANALVDDSGAFIASGDFIGFRTLAADGDVLEFVFQAASQTVNTVADAATLVADDYVKVGFHYRPQAVDTNKKIVYFVNGVEQSTGVSTADIDAATFPEAVALAPALFTKVGTGAEVKVTLDWVACCQYGDPGAAN